MKKKFLFVILFTIFVFGSFSKELAGTDLLAVNMALDAKLYVNNFETSNDQLVYLEGVEKQIKNLGNISEEADLICRISFLMQKELSKAVELEKQEKQQKKKENKKAKAEAAEELVMSCFNQYKDFYESHTDLSSHFYFHYREMEFATAPYLSADKQIKLLKNVFDNYRQIEEMNPEYGEVLLTYGMILYSAPKVAGGDKEAGLAKILKATECSDTNYEKASAFIMYSQLMYEDNQPEIGKIYMTKAHELAPENKNFLEIMKMNDTGYSMFRIKEYSKKMGKE